MNLKIGNIKRDLFDLDKNGYGTAVYSLKKKKEFIHLYVLLIKLIMKKDQIELLQLNGMPLLLYMMVCLLKKILKD